MGIRKHIQYSTVQVTYKNIDNLQISDILYFLLREQYRYIHTLTFKLRYLIVFRKYNKIIFSKIYIYNLKHISCDALRQFLNIFRYIELKGWVYQILI